jgi:hypothetical protein
MASQKGRTTRALSVEVLETRQLPSTSPLSPAGLLSKELFDRTGVGAVPANWSQWSNQGSFAVTNAQALSKSNALAGTGVSGQTSRAWFTTAQAANVQAAAAVYLDTLIPAQVFVRGRGLDTAKPTYYAVSVTRGLEVDLLRVVNGAATRLGRVRSVDYLSNAWVQVTVYANGTNLRAQVYRPDTRQYLNSAGRWQGTATWALSVTDTAITGSGQVGLNKAADYAGRVTFDDFKVQGISSTSAPPVLVQQAFDTTALGALPAGWSQWSNRGPFGVSTARALSSPGSLAGAGPSHQAARAWLNTSLPADIQAGTGIYLDSLSPAQVFIRGTNLGGPTPSYYAASVTRGLEVQLVRVVNGVSTVLGQVRSADYVSNRWVYTTVHGNGANLRVQVYRVDTGQYLTSAGRWQSTPTWALDGTDTSLKGGGRVGLNKPAGSTGPVYYDDFTVVDFEAPALTVTAPKAGATLTSATAVQASASDNVGIDRVEFFLDNVRQVTDTAAPYSWTLDPAKVADGVHTLAVVAYDKVGHSSRTSLSVTTRRSTTVSKLTIPRHYSHIRIAQLAYSGTPLGSFESQLLRNSVDLVVPNPAYLDNINATAPNTPLLIYTNASSLYQDLLTDWLAYADARGVSREGAFYHVVQATRFAGHSASSQPVDWFWGVYRGGSTSGFTDLTQVARSPTRAVAFGGLGQSMYVGYPDRFREININLATVAKGGWAAVLEYPTAVDADGYPTAWAPLTTLANTTAGLTRSGQVRFDPPANWKPAIVDGSKRLFYVRFRTTANGTAPVANTILGHDYVRAGAGISGVIPAFDSAADTNRDGYLNDAEYARRRPGKDARFFYESRVFHGSYGQMRFATNPSNPAFRNWAVDYHFRLLAGQPLADGLFVDNSGGKAPVKDSDVLEPVSTYSSDYGAMLNAIGQRIAPRWLLANTAGGGTVADGVVRQNTAYYEEFAIRALAHNYQQFEDLAGLVEHRSRLRSPAPYAVLDSLPTGGSPTDARTQLATLSYYYLLADPETTFLNFFGGYEPSTSWTRHWSAAAAYNVGLPKGEWSLFATGTDPANRALAYRVYQRSYANALVLYKPLSYSRATSTSGSLAGTTATKHLLGETYRPLRADGTLGAPVTSVTLRNGEGAILVRV